jgi:addiction module HigA family antidote
MNLSQNRLAIDIGVDARRINEIVLGKRAVTADTALRLSRFFGNSPQFWLGLQTQFDLDVAEDQLGKRLVRDVRQFALAVYKKQRLEMGRSFHLHSSRKPTISPRQCIPAGIVTLRTRQNQACPTYHFAVSLLHSAKSSQNRVMNEKTILLRHNFGFSKKKQ